MLFKQTRGRIEPVDLLTERSSSAPPLSNLPSQVYRLDGNEQPKPSSTQTPSKTVRIDFPPQVRHSLELRDNLNFPNRCLTCGEKPILTAKQPQLALLEQTDSNVELAEKQWPLLVGSGCDGVNETV